MTHVPVLVNEVIEQLNLSGGKRFIDATLDGGGHTKEVLKRHPDVSVMGIEVDPAEVRDLNQEQAGMVSRIDLVQDSYVNLERIVREREFPPDAILFDLGLSSWHFQRSGRGFSFQKENEVLDMRFNAEVQSRTAADILNTAEKPELEHILAFYGEEQFAPQIAEEIAHSRRVKPVFTTADLIAVVGRAVPEWYKHQKIHFATKTFQALRVAVNDEIENIKKGIQAGINVLKPGGRLVAISFQGLEDKTVRAVFKKNADAGIIRWVTKRTIRPTWKEIRENPRARSAKMKIAEKI